jgi:hypothetical protein
MAYALRKSLSYALTPRWTIFLDLPSDRYTGLAIEAGMTLTKLAAGETIDGKDHARLAPLVRHGFLRTDAEDDDVAPPTRLDSTMDRPERSRGVSWRRSVIAISSLRRQERRRRTVPLMETVAGLAAHKADCGAAPTDEDIDDLLAVAKAFDRASLLMGSHDRCLSRSVALAHALTGRGHSCDLVFGVATEPFAAHCWVQRDGMVLNDRLDHVRVYTPVLVV